MPSLPKFLKLKVALIVIITASISCKSDKETSASNNLWSYENGSSTTTDGSENKINRNPAPLNQKNQERNVTVETELIPFSTIAALQFLQLEGLSAGMSIKDVLNYNIKSNQTLEKTALRTGNGAFEIYEISKGGVAVLQLYPEGTHIASLMFVGPNSTPKNMVGVGTNYGSLKATYPETQSYGSEVTSQVTVKLSEHISVSMQANHSAYEKVDLKDEVTVLNIIVK
jgi:hypothetical protein